MGESESGSTRVATFESAEDRVLPDLTRLHLLCLLETSQWRRFSFLCQAVGISQDRLKRQFFVMRSAGYLVTRRSADQAGWALLTSHGERRRAVYLDALTYLAARAQDQVQAAQQAQPDWFGQVARP
ncbi:transcriptional regulator [Amycolatopsis vastitatis]|uniref:Transcriptional regulator n=1 Tax=Amycolatopsis vastitatis TaxID=1905142 RepID=A0A229SMK1_9PSEU|nr:transcriptional regulator [Amycolatopsis vastitatis]OXM60014.1 transcriptional regulator [Amycolatopsis vastitatis]